ncbi:MAG: NlpC/P60 family protein [Aerococcaceae bacterium]|nr:NlpC/P60 family protein [Aerococcaceae bacterium]
MKKNLFKGLLASAVVLGSVATPIAALAQDYDALIGETQAAIDGLTAQQTVLYAQLAEAYAGLESIQNEANTLLTAITEDEANIQELNTQVAELTDLINKREALLADQARAIQVNSGSTNYVNLIASSKSITDFVGRVDVVRKMVNVNRDLITAQKEDKATVETKKAEVETTKQSKLDKMVELETLKASLATQTAEVEAVYGQLTADISLAASYRDALVAEKAAFEEAQALAAQQAAAQAAAQQAALEQAAAEQAAAQAEAAQATEVEAVVETTEVTETVAEGTVEATATEEVVEEAVAVEETAEVTTEAEVTEAVAEVPATEVAVEVTEEVAPVAVEEPVAEPVVAEVPAVVEAAPVASTNSGDLLSIASQYLGTPYVWGGRTPGGFDCSGFVQYVYKQAYGIDVGGWTVPQESSGTHISVAEAQPGDLYFWGSPGGTYHVAIATGNGQYIHASQPGTPLEYNNINNFTPSFAVRVNK